MSSFKFVCREEELSYAKESLKNNNFLIYYYFDNSGLSYYLKKLDYDFRELGDVCFYIDCVKKEGIAIQIAKSIVSGLEKKEINKYTKSGSEVTKKIIHSLMTSIDIIPYINMGEIITGFINALTETVDVDLEHLSDYKIEKAVLNMFKKIDSNEKVKNIYLLIDDASSLDTGNLEFLAKMMDLSKIKILATIPYNKKLIYGNENLSKLFNNDVNPHKLENIFKRPDNLMIKGLFHCYGKQYKEIYLNIFERHEHNIHIIMSYIRGFQMDFLQLDSESMSILKILLTLNTYINKLILKNICDRGLNILHEESDFTFDEKINEMITQGFIEIDRLLNIHLNTNIVSEELVVIPLIDKLIISRNIIDEFEQCKNQLTNPQLEFAIKNLDKDYSRRKSYIMILLERQKEQGYIEQQYLDMLFYLDNKDELLNICCMYYNLRIYDIPYIRMQQHNSFSKERDFQLLLALLQERMHKGNYCDTLWKLLENSRNIDEKCLLLAVQFTALFNNGENELCLKILNDNNYEFYYQKYQTSSFFHFLLRNISYYIEDVSKGIDNYSYCLIKFKNADPVNYNRTLSNFIGYLMNHTTQKNAKMVLQEKIGEAKKILEFNDSKYLYLNINYGIYLMTETSEDPTKYFESILHETGTTETPYIYSQINLAMYIAKENPAKALQYLDEIYYNSVFKSEVVPTKIFYKINRLLVEYMNNINNTRLLEEIRENPLRGDKKHAQRLYRFYLDRFEHGIKYKSTDWKKQCLPGYIFYHGFDPKLLLSTSLARPNFTI